MLEGSLNIYNILTPVLQWLNFLIRKLQIATQYFSAFTSTIFGTAQVVSQGAVSAEDMSNAVDRVGSSIKNAGKAAKGALASFDQLNTLTQSSAGNAGDMAGPIGGMGGLNPGGGGTGSVAPSIDTSAISNAVNRVKEVLAPLMAISFDPLIGAFDRLRTALEPLKETAFIGLKWLYDNVLVPFSTWTIEQAVPAFFDALAGAAKVLSPLLESFKPLAQWLWDSFLQPMALWTGGAIVDTLTSLGGVLTTIGDWMTNNQAIVDAITASVVAFMAAWEVTSLLAFIQTSGGVVAAITAITNAIKAGTIAKLADKLETIALTGLYAKDFVVSLISATGRVIAHTAALVSLTVAQIASKLETIAIVALYAKDFVVAFISATGRVIAHTAAVIGSTIAQTALTVATGIWNVAAAIGTAVTWAFDAALAVLTSPITLVIAAIALLALGIYELVKHWDTVKEVAGNVWEWIKSVWSAAYNWFDGHVITPIKDIFSGLWDTVKSVFRGVANTVIDAINFLIRGLNKLQFDVPDWVPEIGGEHIGINIPQIPKLATGGIISSPTLAMVGERGPEAVVPLENTSFVDTLASAVGAAVAAAVSAISNQGSGGQGMPETLVLKIGETEFGRVAIKSINSVHRQTGMTLLTV